MRKVFIIPLLILLMSLFPLSAYASEYDVATDSEATVSSGDTVMEIETITDIVEPNEDIPTNDGISDDLVTDIYVQLAVTNVLLSALMIYLFVHFSIRKGW